MHTEEQARGENHGDPPQPLLVRAEKRQKADDAGEDGLDDRFDRSGYCNDDSRGSRRTVEVKRKLVLQSCNLERDAQAQRQQRRAACKEKRRREADPRDGANRSQLQRHQQAVEENVHRRSRSRRTLADAPYAAMTGTLLRHPRACALAFAVREDGGNGIEI